MLYLLNNIVKGLTVLQRRILLSPNYKRCFKCQNIKSVKGFYPNNKKYQRPAGKGVGSLCIKCIRERDKRIEDGVH
jgi:hypothetical protein